MNLFVQYPPLYKALYLIILSIFCFLSLYAFIESFAQKQKPGSSLKYFVLFLIHFYFGQMLSVHMIEDLDYISDHPIARFFANFTFVDAMLFLLASGSLSLYSLLRLSKTKKIHITHMSIKDGLDHLNSGLCFYRPNGYVLLVNYKMSELCREITGDFLMDANRFWDALTEHQVLEGNQWIEGREHPVIKLKNDEIWSFERIRIEAENKEFYQIIGVDITELECLNRQLVDENLKLQKMNVRLKDFKKFVDQVAHMEEVLAARAKIHDDFGKILLATKLFITQDNPSISDEYIIEMWKKNISLIYEDIFVETAPDPMKPINDVATFVGATIKVSGELPKEKKTLKLMLMAARECLTNAVHHASATELEIEIIQEEKRYRIRYTNNGEIPKDSIKEGSGLSSLRNVVENNGARIQIFSSPKFCLELTIPFEEGRYDYD